MQEIKLSENFGTLSETLNALMKLGYTHDFNVHEENLLCNQTKSILHPEDFQIDKVYRFEGESNPDDQSIVYAISSTKIEMKGTLVDGYGLSSDEQTTKLIERLQTNQAHINIEKKSNGATPLRQEGDRLINAPLVEMNLNKLIEQIKNELTWTKSDRNSLTLFKSDIMRIVLMGLHENAELKAYKANGVISVQVLEGKVNFINEQKTVQLEKGQMIALQANITHSIAAVTESFFLLTLSMNKTD
ncbi:MAG: cupin domain-containing protein [Saprospiraceae bacterium]